MPIYQNGSEWSRIRQAKELVGQRRNELDSARRALAENVIRAWRQLDSSRSRVTSFEAQVRANEVALNGVRQEALVGSRTTLDVLNAEQELLNSQVNLVQARHDVQVAYYGVLAGIGRLTARTLALPVEYYDEERYYNEVGSRWIGWGTAGETAGPAAGASPDDARPAVASGASDERPQERQQDPSMDDILASIRKIISDDEARAQVSSQQAAAQSGAGRPAGDTADRARTARRRPRRRAAAHRPHRGAQVRTPCRRRFRCRGSIRRAPPRCRSRRSSRPARRFVAGRRGRRRRRDLGLRPPQPGRPGQRAAAGRPRSGPDGRATARPSRTLVKEMLRPMLKEWLDRNLPPMVERYVEREIVRLTRR